MKKAQFKAKNQKKRGVEKFEPITYCKGFDSFEEGLNELKQVYPLFNDILTMDGECDSKTPAEATACMVQAFMDHMPDVMNKENLFWSINASSTRCIIKTNHKISFGWKFHYNTKESEDNMIYDVTFYITMLGPDKILSSSIQENGWEEFSK